jgi:hypothetical protein
LVIVSPPDLHLLGAAVLEEEHGLTLEHDASNWPGRALEISGPDDPFIAGGKIGGPKRVGLGKGLL